MNPEPVSRHEPERGSSWLVLARRALIAGVLVAGLRGAFFALKDQYLGAGLIGHALRSFARHLLADGLTCFLPALLLAFLATRRPRRSAWKVAAPVALASLLLGYLFASFRWPAYPFYAPELENARGWLAHGTAGVTALLAALALVVKRRLPLERTLGALALASLVAAAGVVLAAPGLNRSERPNLILISLDTLRRDHLGCYGYGRPTTPELDRFASRSLRFERAFTPQPWTLTAHMSMLTGLYPSAHDLDSDRWLPAGIATLAEHMDREGYQTLAVVDRVVLLHPRFGFARGFDYYQQLPDLAAMKRRRIDELLDDAGADPLFLFLHFYDAHSDWRRIPYEAYPEDVEDFAAGFDPEHEWCDDDGQWASRYLLSLQERGEVLEGEVLEHLVCLYDAGIRSLDRELGRLLASLEARGLFENSVILITADHGEEFFEHGGALHKQSFDECSGVPFLLYTPDGVAGTTDQLASLVDILPTFLELAGAAPAESQGVSLAPLTRGEPLAEERDAVVLESRGGHLGLRGSGWSLVPSSTGLQLFDVSADPRQERDLLGTSEPLDLPDVHALLRRETTLMQAFLERLGVRTGQVEMSAEEWEQLESLGYTGDD